MQRPKLRITLQIAQLVLDSTQAVLNHITGGLFETIVTAMREFSHNRSVDAAASIAYYAIFSLFPLLFSLHPAFILPESFAEKKDGWFLNVFFPHIKTI